MKKIITRISNNERIDIYKLSVDELYKLHFEEEKYVANVLKQLPAFSNERIELLSKCYDIIEPIKQRRNFLEEQNNTKVIDTSVYKIYLYNIFIKVLKRLKKEKNEKITVLELGCGACVFLNKISSIPNLDIHGCDLHPTNISDNINVIKKSIYNTLNSFEDSSIDILVADNVCEHFLEDEADAIYELINKKLSSKGKTIFLIPNIYVGPSDISKKFLKDREKPVGFHFMEQTYKENIRLFKKHNLYTDYIILRKGYTPFLIKNIFFIDKIKIFFEKIFGNLKISMKYKKIIFDHLGYRVYILKK